MAAYNTGRMPRLSLEHLIRSSRDVSSAEGGDNDIIIDRSMYASRKNGRLATITSSFDTAKETRAGDTMRDMTIEAKYWRNLYMTLKQENNEDVQDADNLLQLTLDREAQLLNYARLLERKIDTIIAPLQDSAESIELSKKLDTQRKLLYFYETMTALSVKRRPGTDSGVSDVDDSIYECCLKNQLHRTSTSFSLQIQDASTTSIEQKSKKDRQVGRKSQLRDDAAAGAVCRYEPITNAQVLPQYLHKAIDCELSMAPVILSDVLHAVYETV